MRTISLLFILLIAIISSTTAQTKSDSIIGFWEAQNKGSKMEIFKSGNTYSGRLIWAEAVMEADGKTFKKDTKNPDNTLQNRVIEGIIFITGLTYSDEVWHSGKIYDASRGKTYDCKLTIKNNNLYLRGFAGIPILGQTVIYKRYYPN